MEWLLFGIAVIVVFMIFMRLRSEPKFLPEDWCRTILVAGHNSGRPKGLKWLICRPTGVVVWSADSRMVFAGYEIRFEPIPGSEMEGIDAATIPRPVTVVFERSGRNWRMTRPPIFNLSPGDVHEQSRKPPA